ncbi:MAG: hypothetical protein AB7F97_09160 [Solirubrobacterales bacterium]
MTITISAEQREALYIQVLDHLSGLSDLWLAIDARDFEKADALGRAFADVINGNLVYRQKDLDVESTAALDLEVER